MSPSHYQRLDYTTLDQALADIGAGIGASEVHGIICGVSCVPDTEDTHWVAEIIDDVVTEVNPDLCAELLEAIYESAREQLGSTNFEFELMLPNEYELLDLRSAALGEWCTGFLFGLTFAGTVSLDSLPEDSREVVEDLSKFASIRATNSDDDDDEEEAAFLELVEYIRVGVKVISKDLYAAAHESTSPTLH